MLTVEPASAVPVIRGSLLFAGEAGVVPRAEGAAGAAESSTYEIDEEQLDWLPAASVARAVYEVVELSAMSGGFSPAPPKAAAVPEATEPPEQSEVA